MQSSTTDASTYAHAHWPSGAYVSVKKLQEASPPIAGKFSVVFKDHAVLGKQGSYAHVPQYMQQATY